MSNPTAAPECSCPWDDDTNLRDYDPGCPEHGTEPWLEAPQPEGVA